MQRSNGSAEPMTVVLTRRAMLLGFIDFEVVILVLVFVLILELV